VIDDLIGLARRLARSSPKKPRQADLWRAVSKAYYALFNAMAKNVADTMVGAVKRNRSEAAWVQAYRGLQHGDAKTACEAVRNMDFPPSFKDCANAFVQLQLARQDADYDPIHRLSRTDALLAVDRAEDAVRKLRSADTEEPPSVRRSGADQETLKPASTEANGSPASWRDIRARRE
jgi:hypothetical protein